MTIHISGIAKSGGRIGNVGEVFRFPGGEPHFRFLLDKERFKTLIGEVHGGDPADLIGLGMMANAAWQLDMDSVGILPYLPAARSDRGTPTGAVVYREVINSFGLDQVITLDPHSPMMPRGLLNSTVADPTPLIVRAVEDAKLDVAGVIAPDAGAVHRAALVASTLCVPLYKASKTRDFATGRIQELTCDPIPTAPVGKKYLVVDDICDGGGTFRFLADATLRPPEELALWVTHGIFSGSASLLRESYSEILTTNSHLAGGSIVATTVVPVFTYLDSHIKETFK